LQAEVPAQYGTDGELEEDARAAQGYCAGENDCPRARDCRRNNGEEVMAETNAQAVGRRKEVIGAVVSNKMSKTIVVQVVRKKAHPFYGRVVSKRSEEHTSEL